MVPVPPKVDESDDAPISWDVEMDPVISADRDTVVMVGALSLSGTGSPIRMGEGFGSVDVETRCVQKLWISQTLLPGRYHLAGIGPAAETLGKESGNDDSVLRTVFFIKALLPPRPKQMPTVSSQPHTHNILIVKDWMEVEQADAVRFLTDTKYHPNGHKAFFECQRLVQEGKAHHLHTSAMVTNSGQRASLNSLWMYPIIRQPHDADWLHPMPPGSSLATPSNLFQIPVSVDELSMMEVGERFEFDPVLSEDSRQVDAYLSDSVCSLVGAKRNPNGNFLDPIFREAKISAALVFGIGQCQIVGSQNASRVGQISGFTPSTKRILRFVRVFVDAPPPSFPPLTEETNIDIDGDPFATPVRE
jgi:hypothetical protein